MYIKGLMYIKASQATTQAQVMKVSEVVNGDKVLTNFRNLVENFGPW